MASNGSDLSEALELRDRLLKQFKELDDIRHALRKVVDRAQNPPPDGEGDGSLVDPQWSQCKSIVKSLDSLLLSQLFDTR
jgi:hypothetical protein